MGDLAAEFAEAFGWAEAARVAGRLHDIGKCSAEFQAYIAQGTDRADRVRGPDHSTAGARVALEKLPSPLGKMLAFAIAGHHAGLADGADLGGRLDPAQRTIPAFSGWEAHAGPLPAGRAFSPTQRLKRSPEAGFSEAFLIRMIFSCLVDADFLETERFYAQGEPLGRGGHLDLATLRDRLRDHMAALRAKAPPTPLNALRAEILDHAIGKAALEPDLFTLTVPTGGGKTLASLSFALEHAVRHGLRRVVYVIPFTSIIEQTAAVFRGALGTGPGQPNETDVLEHHATFDWEVAAERSRESGRGFDAVDTLRRASENWDVPIVVTTAVQFFESLFANRTSRCRKLHNLAQSVIVLDEAQTLPLRILRPCLAALDELARNYGASAVICTATQPAWRKVDEALIDKQKRPYGLDIPKERELAPEPERLYRHLKRVQVEYRPEPIEDEAIASRFSERPQMLCIVNSRRHAQALFQRIRDLPGAVHLTTLMCPRHRRIVLAGLRERLAAGAPVRIVSTSLIEAGVDLDLPEVWRAATGLDSIAQAAGRCNREGRLEMGRVVVFQPVEREETKTPRDIAQFWQAARPVLRCHPDPLTLEAVREYFRELYWQKGADAVDATMVGGYRGVLPAIAEHAPGRGEADPKLAFPFASIAEAFRVIEDTMEPVIVPWRANDKDREAETLLARIGAMERPRSADLRRLQQYTVAIPPQAREEWLACGVLRPVNPALGDTLLRFEDLSHYDDAVGVRLAEPTYRSAERNIFP